MIWNAVTSTRNKLYDTGYLKSYRSKLPVISIGNLTVGGNGKTPLAIYLCKTLSRLGFHPVTLLRGYKGDLHGPELVLPEHTSLDVGDEAKLIARETGLPVVISRKRVDGAKLIEQNEYGNLIVLDDGLQHRALARDVELITVFTGSKKARAEFLQGKVLPFGRFREGRDVGLKRAHAVIVSERKPVETEEIDQAIAELLPDSATVFKSQLLPRIVRTIAVPHTSLASQPCIAFCGLANPEGFFSSLESFGFPVKHRQAFADHYRYSASDIAKLQKLDPTLPLICTTKDAVKLTELSISEKVYEFVTEMHVTPEEDFLELLFSKIRGSRHDIKE